LEHLMGVHHDSIRPAGRPIRRHIRATSTSAALALVAVVVLAGCTSGPSTTGSAPSTPSQSIAPTPNYADACAPVGGDSSSTCLRLTLQAIDTARAGEGLRPMALPSNFAHLSVPEQLFVALNRERVDRGLPAFAGLSAGLDSNAQKGAGSAQLPPRPGRDYASVDAEWIGAVDNGLDADYQWMYNDGPNSGVPNCSNAKTSGCWADRQIVLEHFGTRHLVMGAAFDPTGDVSPGDRGGSSLAATLASLAFDRPPAGYAYSWNDALVATKAGTMRPLRSIPASESNAGIADPAGNVLPAPDYTRVCADNGIDNSPVCIGDVLEAINHAHALEGVRPMVLPAGFAQLSVPEQLFVAVNLERVDRGLPPFGGLTTDLNHNAQRGAEKANDPPDPGPAYVLDDAEWAGGSSNGLDAVYGWMYDDGFNSGNLDCLRREAAGCWGHRKGILDDFGAGAN
jgi:hypothetical protein